MDDINRQYDRTVVENRPARGAQPLPDGGRAGDTRSMQGNREYFRSQSGYDNAYAPAGANHEQILLASGANLLLGLWLIAAPFVLTYTTATARGNDVALGIIIATIAAVRVFGAYRAAWLSWTNALAGVWLIIAPFVLGYGGYAHPMWNDIITGALVVLFGTWSALATHGTFGSRQS